METDHNKRLLMDFLFFLSRKLNIEVDYIGWINEYLNEKKEGK